VTSTLWSYQVASFTPGGKTSFEFARTFLMSSAICTLLPSGCW